MRIAVGLIAATLSIGPALAQMPGMKLPMGSDRTLTDEEKAKNAQREQDYKSAIGKIPDQKAADPWGNVRSADTPSKTNKKPPQSGAKQ
jgi:hypothetical protein